MSAARHRLLPLALGWLLAGSTHAALERPPFAAPPPAGSLPLPGAAAVTDDVLRPCGWLGHDRPFHLPALAGNHAILAAPLGWGILLGGGIALRGPARHREHATWLAAGRHLVPWLRLGVALHRRGWSAPPHGAAAWLPGVAARLELPRGWRLRLQLRRRIGLLRGRWSVSLSYDDADGTLEAQRTVATGTPSRAGVRLASHLGRQLDLWLAARSRPGELGAGATLRRADLRAWMSVHEHGALGTTPAWGLGRACR